ncbi:hypothetical protein ES703_43022 [subsurface metagenome]
MIYNGDCLDILPQLEDNSIDLLATDPPYGISFMGKDWDKALPDKRIWAECLRVLKPGSFAFVMSIPRSDCQARMVIALQDAGFRVDFTPIYWAYASGFPKAQNIGKAVDKKLGAKREVIGKNPNVPQRHNTGSGSLNWNESLRDYNDNSITKSATPQAKALDGSYGGFQPKPAVEVIIVCMKPLSEKTFVDQALKNRKGITWLDSVRIPASSGDNAFDALLKACDSIRGFVSPTTLCNRNYINHIHRVGDSDYTLGKELRLWLSFCQDGEAGSVKHWNEVLSSQYDYLAYCHLYDGLVHLLEAGDQDVAPSQADVLADIRQFALLHKHSQHHQYSDPLSICDGLLHILAVLALDDNLAFPTSLFTLYHNYTSNASSRFPANLLCSDNILDDTSKFFDLDKWAQKTFPFLIVPKASKSEKNRGCEDLPEYIVDCLEGNKDGTLNKRTQHQPSRARNYHPTVKPLKLMSYLITLGSREGDTILDPFLGSGTTALACQLLNRECIGIELEEKYCEIAERRCSQKVLV